MPSPSPNFFSLFIEFNKEKIKFISLAFGARRRCRNRSFNCRRRRWRNKYRTDFFRYRVADYFSFEFFAKRFLRSNVDVGIFLRSHDDRILFFSLDGRPNVETDRFSPQLPTGMASKDKYFAFCFSPKNFLHDNIFVWTNQKTPAAITWRALEFFDLEKSRKFFININVDTEMST